MIEINETTYGFRMPSGDLVEVGDREASKFKPHLKLPRWDDECWIKVKMAGDIEGEVEYEVEENKVKTKYKVKYGEYEQEIETEFEPLAPTEQCELGIFEFNIILPTKPTTNRIILALESQGLKFCYQPPLTQKEIEEGAIRPDNIVGSYAVYHATKGGLVNSRGKNYMAGKAFHIPRPKIIDDAGNWVWGELFIDTINGLQIVTIPQEFLEYAKYPIRHAAGDTFGFTGIGGTPLAVHRDTILASLATGAAGTGNSMSWYGDTYSSSFDAKMALYKESDDYLETNGITDETADPSTTEWHTENFTVEPTLTAISYWLSVFLDCTGAGGYDDHVYYDTEADKGNAEEQSYDGWPDPIVWDDILADYKFSIYCTYTPSAPPAGAVGRLVYGGLVNSGLVGGRLIG